MVDEGIQCLGKALEIRPTGFDAMEYQNLLWREKAKFEKDEKEKAALLHQAGTWYRRRLSRFN